MKQSEVVIVGHNENMAHEQQMVNWMWKTRKISGAYANYSFRSVRFSDGKSSDYPYLINMALEAEGCPRIETLTDPLNPAFPNLASYLRRHDHQVKIIKSFQDEKYRLRQFVDLRPTAVVITTMFYELWDNKPVREIIDFIRQLDPEVPIVLGGPKIYRYCKLNPDEDQQNRYFQKLGADIYVIEEKGLETLSLVADVLKSGTLAPLLNVGNLAIKGPDGHFTQTKKCEEVTSLADHVIDWKQFSKEITCRTGYLQTSRGCRFRCRFCNYPKFFSSMESKPLEFKKKEMCDLRDLGIGLLFFTDDSFNIPLPHFKAILKMMIKEKFNFSWSSFIRASNLDQEAIELMAESGALSVFLGLESGDQKILDNMNKAAVLNNYAKSIDGLNLAGILSFASLIVGFPGESRNSVMNTVSFMENHPTTFYDVNFYYHDKLADVNAMAAEYGITGEQCGWKHKSMTWQEAIQWKEYMIDNIQSSIYAPKLCFYIPMMLQEGYSLGLIKHLLVYLNKMMQTSRMSVSYIEQKNIVEYLRKNIHDSICL